MGCLGSTSDHLHHAILFLHIDEHAFSSIIHNIDSKYAMLFRTHYDRPLLGQTSEGTSRYLLKVSSGDKVHNTYRT